MSTKDRRQRERAEREQRFLDKAQTLIQRDGLLALQMSRIAEECDYAIGTLYQHFASKEDLLVTLATRNSLSRVDLFERAARWPGPSRERMLAIALADLMVIKVQPEHFRLAQYVRTDVIWGAASLETRQRSLEASAPLCVMVDGIVEDAIAAGDLRNDIGLSSRSFAIGPWALSLGMHSLTHTEGLLQPHALGDPYRLLMKHIHFLLNGYGWQPLFRRLHPWAFC
jgi:AcrR family transcriptional regulator